MGSDIFGYSADTGQLVTAASMATVASMMLAEFPVAKQIALAMGAVVGNPQSMLDAAGQWQAPSTGDGEIDFDGIRQQVVGLKARIEEGELWKGPAEEVFGDSLDRLIEQLDVAKQHFASVGNSMEFVAGLYHLAAEVFMYVALGMLIGATAYLILKYTSPGPGRIMGAISLLQNHLYPWAAMVKGLSAKLVKTLMMTTGIVAMVNFMCASMSQMLTQNRPKPDYTLTGVEYTPPEQEDGVGGLKPTNDGMPTMPDTGGGGMMGLI